MQTNGPRARARVFVCMSVCVGARGTHQLTPKHYTGDNHSIYFHNLEKDAKLCFDIFSYVHYSYSSLKYLKY